MKPHRPPHPDARDDPAGLLTTGYEAETLDATLARLLAHRVEVLVDVRAIAQSRKPGFSKTLLSASLQASGIDYLHLRGLGTPKAGRIAARAGNVAELHRIFGQHMATEAAQHELAGLAALATRRRCCLLCFERDHTTCHRSIVADMVGLPVTHV